MSPVTRKRPKVKRTPEWKLRGSGQGFGNKYAKVKVVVDRIEVMWLDGTSCATRSFTPHALRELILYIDGTATRYPDMWLGIRDSARREFFIHVEDGKLTANAELSDHGFVAWDELEAAFQEALNELESEKDSEKS